MQRILIFSGTTEGRELAETLTEAGIFCVVCVATEYGKEVMETREHLEIHQGRMKESAMEELMREESFLAVVDATHPYAVEVSENIRKSAEKIGLSYLRLKRDTETERRLAEELGTVTYVKSTAECVSALKGMAGNIFLTTGSKELGCYAAEEELRSRLYVRVLPGTESLGICQEQGLSGKQIIAMQGPFSVELNAALLRQYQISVLVTKESGHAGGFLEKIEAAGRVGVPVVVIGNPDVEEGTTREEILQRISQMFGILFDKRKPAATPPEESRKSANMLLEEGKKPVDVLPEEIKSSDTPPEEDQKGIQIFLVGLGMGAVDLLTGEAKAAIEQADYLFGAKRILAAVSEALNGTAVRRASYLPKEIIPCLEELYRQGQNAKAVLLFSGDTGFYSGADGMYRALKEAIAAGRIQGEIRIMPGISAISYLAAKAGTSWQDAKIVSIHGKTPCKAFNLPCKVFDTPGDTYDLPCKTFGSPCRTLNLLGIIASEPKVFLLVSGVRDMQMLGEALLAEGMDEVRITVGYQLSYPGEAVLTLTPGECADLKEEGLYACIIENPRAGARVLTPGIPDSGFLRDKVPMTKEEVREISLCKLRLHRDAVFYDVGSGTGSIAVEAAGLSDSIQVYAVEKKELALSLIRENCRKFGRQNVRIIAGEAPEILSGLPAPTHAFIGGSSGNLREILSCLYQKNPGMRVVLNAISLETVAEITGLMKELPVCEEEILQVQVSRAKTAGTYHLMQAENPITIVSFCFCQEEVECR